MDSDFNMSAYLLFLYVISVMYEYIFQKEIKW